MDRIPATNEGALGGSRETSASGVAGGLRSRFGERRVSEAPQAQRPHPGQGHATGSGAAPAEGLRSIRSRLATEVPSSSRLSGATALPYPVPWHGAPAQPPLRWPVTPGPPGDPRAGHGPAGSRVLAVIDTPGTSSGASAAGAVRAPGTLPEPAPLQTYQSHWHSFVFWCKARNERPWPASPEQVADYLNECAEGCGYSSLRKVRTAIATTHSSAGLENPCSSRLVSAALAEHAPAMGLKRDRSTNISGRALDATELDTVRAAAPEPRRRGSGVESPQDARRRGLVDVALCSVVLEAGLRCTQAAALKWGDLGKDANGGPAIRVGTGSSRAGDLIGISTRALDDLKAIAPKGPAPDSRIFAFSARQTCDRIRRAARAVGLESKIAGEEILREPLAAATHTTEQIARTRARRWQAFSAWCDARGFEKLPARAETVAVYLREGSGSASLGSVLANTDAIANAHREAGLDDPCATGLVEATVRDIRGQGTHITPRSLDAGAIEAIRATALQPRPRGRGWEAGPYARQRGLIDIALCSVLYSTALTMEEIVALHWGDVETLGAGNVRLTVRGKADPVGGSVVCELTREAARDLEAIRGYAGPEDIVIGISQGAAYRRVRTAARAAGL